MRAGMAAGADRLLGLGARAHHGASGAEIVLDQRRLRGFRIARDRPPLRGLAAPAALRPSDGVDAVLPLAAKAFEGDVLDSAKASRDQYVAHDSVVAGAHRAPVHEIAEIAAGRGALLHLDQPGAIERRLRHRVFARLLEALLVRPLPVALDLRLGGADHENGSKQQDSQTWSQFRSAASAPRTSGRSSALAR